MNELPPRVAEILDAYLRALEKGEAPNRETMLARHKDLADELGAALDTLDFVHRASHGLAGEKGGDDAGPGKALGDYRLLREVGRGGMAVVYEAEQVSLGRRVALKVLPFAAVLDPKQLQRFKNEALAAAHLRHPNIVPVYGVGCERGVHYYAMQYVEGQSLAQAIRDLKGGGTGEGARTPISSHGSNREPAYIRMAATLGMQAAEALDHAHELGIVHRDVKPGNLLVDEAGTLWVTDFGLASSVADVSLTVTGEILGTIRYMSPEQALAKRAPIDHRTDVYSLGATLYELFTLEPAFKGDDPHLVIQDIATKEPVPPRKLNPALPVDLETVLLKAMSKDPAARYTTAKELADDLDRFLGDRPIAAKRPGLARRAGKWGRRHRRLVATAVALLVLAVAGLATGATLLLGEKRRTDAALQRADNNLVLALQALNRICIIETDAYSTPRIREGLPDDVLESALGFYDAFARRNAGIPFAAHETGTAHFAAGLMFRRLGRKDRAQEAFDRAVSAFQSVVRQRPDDFGGHCNLANALAESGDRVRAIQEHREAIRIRPDFAVLHYNFSIALRDSGDLEGAIRELQEAIRLAPDLVAAHGQLSAALRAKKDLEGAIREAREAIRLRPDLADPHVHLGVALHDSGDRNGAIRAYREAIRLEPTDALAHHNLGNSLREAGEEDAAIQEYREATRLEPRDASYHRALGYALKARGDLDGAVAALAEACRLEPEDAEAHRGLGNALLGKGETDAAIEQYREAIRLVPELATARNDLGNALLEKGDPDGAIRELGEALRLKPDYAEAHCHLGNALKDKGEIDAAVEQYREAIRWKPQLAMPHNNLGNALRQRGDLDGAIPEFREAIRLEPDLVMAHWNLGIALRARGDPDGAIAALAEAVRLEPDHVPARRDLACARANQGDYDGAIREFREIVRLCPDSGAARNDLAIALLESGDAKGAIAEFLETIRVAPDRALYHFNLGNAYSANRDLEHAIASYREAIRLDPRHAPSRCGLAVALARTGDVDGAIAEYGEAIRLAPDDANAHYGLAIVLKDKGRMDDSVEQYREAIRLRPSYAEAHCNLGNVLKARGEIDAAADRYREAIRLKPDLIQAHAGLAGLLFNTGNFAGAIEEYREMTRLEPDYAEAWCNMGQALTELGRFREALPPLRRGHELGSARPDWPYASAEWVEDAERKAAVEARLDQVLAGEASPHDAAEQAEFAQVLHAQGRYAEATRMWVAAFAEDAALADDLARWHRYSAACSAALAAAGGDGAAVEWRRRALGWLRADLAARLGMPDLAAWLEHWKRDRDLVSVRDRTDELPGPEREAWRSLWAAVDQALVAARPPAK